MTGGADCRKRGAMFRRALLVSSCILFVAVGTACLAEAPPALGGASRPAYPPKRMANTYDVVAYVEDGHPAVGDRAHQVVHAGGLYYFASQANLDRFRADPQRYTPAYNGWCSGAMAKGMRMTANGREFEVMDGQLYLFHDADIHAAWKQDPRGWVRQATANWSTRR